ncbi:putative coupling protein [Staphylococcus aureus]|nr:putative coupling protein [Staphylococcus aureus]
MFNSELVEKKHIGRYLRYEFMPLKYKKRIVMNGEQESNTIFYDTKIAITHQITWDFGESTSWIGYRYNRRW